MSSNASRASKALNEYSVDSTASATSWGPHGVRRWRAGRVDPKHELLHRFSVRAVRDGNDHRLDTSRREQRLDGFQRFLDVGLDLGVSRHGHGHAEAAPVAEDLGRIQVPLFEYGVRRDLEEVAQVARARRGVGHLFEQPRTSRSGGRRDELTAYSRARASAGGGSIWHSVRCRARAEI